MNTNLFEYLRVTRSSNKSAAQDRQVHHAVMAVVAVMPVVMVVMVRTVRRTLWVGIASLSLLVRAISAETATLEITYDCAFPLIGTLPVIIDIESDIPEFVPVGEPTDPFRIEAIARVPEPARNGLYFVGAETLEGAVRAEALLSGPALALELNVPVQIENQPIPDQPGEFEIAAWGETPALTFSESNSGEVSISVGNMVMTLEPKDHQGRLTGLGEFESECIAQSGQDQLLRTFRVGADEDVEINMAIAGETLMGTTASPAPLSGSMDLNMSGAGGPLTADLQLEETRAKFPLRFLLNLMTVEAEIAFEQAAEATGSFFDDRLFLQTEMDVLLPNVRLKMFGLTLMRLDDASCRTRAPVQLALETTEGSDFSLDEGGALSGDYALGKFENCGALQDIINLLLPSQGNRIDLSATL